MSMRRPWQDIAEAMPSGPCTIPHTVALHQDRRPIASERRGARTGGQAMNVVQKTETPTAEAQRMYLALPQPPVFASVEDERLHRKQRLAAAFRLFSKFGFDEGVVGHITARDPEFTDTFWVNPFGLHFSLLTVSDLIRVGHDGKVLEGNRPVNAAAFAIHSRIHAARPDAVGAAHAHSTYGRAFAALGRKLDPISQDVCAFYNDHALYTDYGGVAVELDEGRQIAEALGPCKPRSCKITVC